MTDKIIIFDCDGTLIDSVGHIVKTVQDAFATFNQPLPEGQIIRSHIGLPLADHLLSIAPALKRPVLEKIMVFCRQQFNAPDSHLKKNDTLFPSILPLLDFLKAQGFPLAIATGRGRQSLVKSLQFHGIHDYFITLRSADDGPGKPDPSILLDILSETGMDCENALMVGDTVFDIEAANNAGMRSIGVTWGYNSRDALLRAGATTVIESPEAFVRQMDSIRKK